jgi:4-amino-4-deoxy-L-arabinose transferase-like glycosyltransferase
VLLHLWTLSWFPFVHSDEVWLASLTRGISERGLSATEDFFILTPRYPHALKSLYHVLQIPFLQSDWSIVSARMLSFISALLVLLLLFHIFRRVFSLWAAFFLTFLLAFDSWFFSASHMSRQEMMILLLTVLAFFCLVKGNYTADKKEGNEKKWGRYVFFAALFVGVGIFVHPNSCIAMAAVFPWVLALSEPAQKCKSIFCILLHASFFFV